MSDGRFSIHRVTGSDALDQLVDRINAPRWDDANDLTPFSAERLHAFVRRPDCVFLVCREHRPDSVSVVGLASAQLLIKPHSARPSLYVDEIDVRPTHRRQGIGQRLMTSLMGIAQARNCRELWLATEEDNVAARQLYDALQPTDCTSARVYAFDAKRMRDITKSKAPRP